MAASDRQAAQGMAAGGRETVFLQKERKTGCRT